MTAAVGVVRFHRDPRPLNERPAKYSVPILPGATNDVNEEVLKESKTDHLAVGCEMRLRRRRGRVPLDIMKAARNSDCRSRIPRVEKAEFGLG
jgi:hypothetical protein